MKRATRLVHAGRKAHVEPGLVNLPVARASTVTFDSMAHMRDVQRRFDAGEPVPTYGITNMPLRVAFEELMVEIEGGHRAATYPSGLAAVASAILATVQAGDHILVTDAVYGPTRMFCDRTLKRFGVATEYYDPLAGPDIEGLMKPNTRAVYLESPGSLTFEVQDFPAIAKVARARGAAVIHDNTWATGINFRSFEHGADLVIQAATKYPAGHSDVLIGAVVANEQWWPRLKETTRDLGQTASPDDLWLTLRGMRTLDVRLREQSASALFIAQGLQGHAAIARVLHPALEDHPQHALWRRDFLGATGLFGIELRPAPREKVERFVESLQLFTLGYSWGGFESLVTLADLDRYGRTAVPWTGGPVVRLQIGLEDPQDLLDDLRQALALIAT